MFELKTCNSGFINALDVQQAKGVNETLNLKKCYNQKLTWIIVDFLVLLGPDISSFVRTTWFLIEFKKHNFQDIFGEKYPSKKTMRPTSMSHNDDQIFGSRRPLDLNRRPPECAT